MQPVRLWQRLFLACAALSVLTIGGYALWQQRLFARGFVAYLDGVALQRAQRAAETLQAAYGVQGNWDFLRGQPRRFAELVGESVPPPGPFQPLPPPRGGGSGTAHAMPSPGDAREGIVPARPSFPPPPGSDRGRLRLVDAQGHFVAGARDAGAVAARVPLRLDGQDIGELRVMPMQRADDTLEAAFAQDQWRGARIALAAILPIALVLSFMLARRLLGPVRALSDGTRALAEGRYDQRLAVSGRDEIAGLGRDFNHLADTLERHRHTRQQWGQDIAHELRTPLTVLQAELQTLIDGVRPITASALASLLAECERLSSLVDDLHQLALADTAALEYRFEDVDLAALVEDVVDAHRGAFAADRMVLTCELPPTPLWVRGDPIRLSQLVDNLLLNARRHTEIPGRIALWLGQEGDRLRLSIEDSPPGVADEDLPRLFERLFRADRSRARSAGGAGLGLAICRAIVDAHGGTITARSSPLGGVAVDVRLPLR